MANLPELFDAQHTPCQTVVDISAIELPELYPIDAAEAFQWN